LLITSSDPRYFDFFSLRFTTFYFVPTIPFFQQFYYFDVLHLISINLQ